MIVDTSAIMAIILKEPEQERFARLIHDHGNAFLSSGSWIELGAVLTRGYKGAYDVFVEKLFADLRIRIAPVTSDQAQIGRDAYRRYGIGTGHRARLNFGDCFAYALAIERNAPLLFKGDDFVHTDVCAAI